VRAREAATRQMATSVRGAWGKTICLRLSGRDYETLSVLARFHRSTVPKLIRNALPRVIERYRVLQALDRRLDEAPGGRRRR